MNANLAAILYLVAGVLFILSLRGLSSPASSRRGNFLGMAGMAIAVATTLAAHPPADGIAWVLVVLGVAIGGSVGAVIARRVPMTAMPELVAAFHSLVGMAAVLVAAGAFYAPEAFDIGTPGNIHGASLVEMSLGVAIGALTFTGSVIAFLKLSGRMSGAPIILPARHIINIALGIALVVFIVGLVMSGSALDFWLITIIAVAQAQHALREMADQLKKEGVEVKYAIHPVAGRMPGHMNVLLAEANVPYDEVFELEDINSEFAQADVAFVIGANDVTNPAAEEDPDSPIYGMPVLEVWKAGTVMFSKRSLSSGYAGIDNTLFYRDNTMMLFGDAKKMTEQIVKSL